MTENGDGGILKRKIMLLGNLNKAQQGQIIDNIDVFN